MNLINFTQVLDDIQARTETYDQTKWADTQLIVCETKKGKASPARVWVAESAADYVSKIWARYPRADVDISMMSLDQAAAYDGESTASRVEFFTKDEVVEAYNLEPQILRIAASIGWTEGDQD